MKLKYVGSTSDDVASSKPTSKALSALEKLKKGETSSPIDAVESVKDYVADHVETLKQSETLTVGEQHDEVTPMVEHLPTDAPETLEDITDGASQVSIHVEGYDSPIMPDMDTQVFTGNLVDDADLGYLDAETLAKLQAAQDRDPLPTVDEDNQPLRRAHKDSDDKKPISKRMVAAIGGAILIGLIATAVVMMLTSSTKKKASTKEPGIVNLARSMSEAETTNTETPTTESETAPTTNDLPDEEGARAALEEVAKATGIEYEIKTQTIGGGYMLGLTTYHPNDLVTKYTDYTLSKTANVQEVSTDEKALAIEAKLKDGLPAEGAAKIGDTIEVADVTKLTMETYKVDNTYQTILLHDGKPFAYIETDDLDIQTPIVTSFYLTTVAPQ